MKRTRTKDSIEVFKCIQPNQEKKVKISPNFTEQVQLFIQEYKLTKKLELT